MKPLFFPILVSLLFLMVCMGAASSHAIAITTNDGNGADSFVRWHESGPEPDMNFGSLTSVRIRDAFFPTGQFNNARKMYLRFDLSAIEGATVLDASLNLEFLGGDLAPATLNLFGLTDGDSGEDWGESTLTWNNAPGNAQSGSGLNSGNTQLLASSIRPFDSSPGSIVSWTSPELVSFLNSDSDGQVTLILVGVLGQNNFNSFGSKESAGAGPPTLELTLVPEPSTAMMMLMGLAGLASRRR